MKDFLAFKSRSYSNWLLFLLIFAVINLIAYDLAFGHVVNDSHVWIRQLILGPREAFPCESVSTNRTNITKDLNVFNISTIKETQYPFIMLRPSTHVLQGASNTSTKSSFIIFLYKSPDLVSDAMRKGGWENQIISPLLRFLQERPGVDFLDFGSFVGAYTLHVANLGRKVVAVDANRENLNRLGMSASANSFQDRVTLVHNALDSSHGTRYLHLVPSNSGATTVQSYGKNGTKVKAITADDLLRVIRFKRAVLKVGIENFALKGASCLFSTVDIVMVLMKWNKTRETTERQFIHHFLESRGFEAYQGINSSTKLSEDDRMWPIDVVWKRIL